MLHIFDIFRDFIVKRLTSSTSAIWVPYTNTKTSRVLYLRNLELQLHS